MKRLRFLISLPTSMNDFQLAQAFSAEQTAHKRAIDVEIVYADNDAVNQSTQILKAIQAPVESRPDAIVIEPASGTALPQVARAACAVGIGWAVLNRAPDYISELRRTATAPIFAVSSDHVEIGRIQEINLQRCFQPVARFSILKDPRIALQPKTARWGC
jgi:ribose transport system substrate-binding protein